MVDAWLGMNGAVYALTVDDNGDLYAGGGFTTAGSVAANHIARWDGSAWYPLGVGVNAAVRSLAQEEGSQDLYVGGDFTSAGGLEANHVARWDGSSWSPLGSGMGGSWDPTVSALAVDQGGILYAGGRFTLAGGGTVNHIAWWDGDAWTSPGPGTISLVNALVVDPGGYLFAGGGFDLSNGMDSFGSRWDGATWNAQGVGEGANLSLFTLVMDPDQNLYAGGGFTIAGGVPANGIAVWDGDVWSPLGAGVNGGVYAIAMDSDGNLYAGGRFTTADDSTVNYIARWDGSEWTTLGSGMNSWVYALTVDDNGDLYAGGEFTIAGGVAANHVARWDGDTWLPLGTGINGNVMSLVLDGGGNLYAGGHFSAAGGAEANNVASWDGASWSPLGVGTNNVVDALVVDEKKVLYAGGAFTAAGGTAVNYIARWDGFAWSPLGLGVDYFVHTLKLDPVGKIVAGGEFTIADGVEASRIARWDGKGWAPFGSGIQGAPSNPPVIGCVHALAFDGSGGLYAGGAFTTAGGNRADNIAHWINTPPSVIADGFTVDEDSQVNLFDVLANDSDPEDGPLAISAVGETDRGGSITFTESSITYTPAEDFSGQETFSYTVSDGLGGYANGIVTVTVAGVNDAPFLDPIGAQNVVVGSQLSLVITASDVDLPAQILAFSLVEAPEGTSITPAGLFTWTPTKDQAGTEYELSVKVMDDGSPPVSDTQTFTVTVVRGEYEIYCPVIRK